MKPHERCPCCGNVLEYSPYSGRFTRDLFGVKRGAVVKNLCGACYCMLFRESIIDRGDYAKEPRTFSNTCGGCQLHRAKIFDYTKERRERTKEEQG